MSQTPMKIKVEKISTTIVRVACFHATQHFRFDSEVDSWVLDTDISTPSLTQQIDNFLEQKKGKPVNCSAPNIVKTVVEEGHYFFDMTCSLIYEMEKIETRTQQVSPTDAMKLLSAMGAASNGSQT